MARELTPQEEIALIRQKLNHYEWEVKKKKYLDLGNDDLNSTLGKAGKGPRFGSMMELFGNESNGKTQTAMKILAKAQSVGAYAAWADAENVWDKTWAKINGINTQKLALFEPYLMTLKDPSKLSDAQKKEAKVTLIDAEGMCDEIEEWLKFKHRKDPDTPIIMVLDSLTALVTAYEAKNKIVDKNMKTGLALASFLSTTLKRWTGLFKTHDVLGVFINQIRLNPNQMFGNPEYTPGGKAMKFYAHVRAQVGRTSGKNGPILQNGKVVGYKGLIKNVKNRSGSGEKAMCGFKYWKDGKYKYVPASEIKSKSDGESEE